MDNKKYIFITPKKRKKSGNNKNKKYIFNTLAYVLSVVLLFAAVPMLINTFTSAEGCTHVCDDTCGFVAASPCTYVHVHNDGCGYDEEEGTSCGYVHTHSPDCGFAAGAPCTYVCVEGVVSSDDNASNVGDATNNVNENEDALDTEDNTDEINNDDDTDIVTVDEIETLLPVPTVEPKPTPQTGITINEEENENTFLNELIERYSFLPMLMSMDAFDLDLPIDLDTAVISLKDMDKLVYNGNEQNLNEGNFIVKVDNVEVPETYYTMVISGTARNAGESITVTINEVNDFSTGTTSEIFTIEPKPLSLTDITHTKVYDGSEATTDLTFTTANLSGWEVSDATNVTIATASTVYTSAAAGTTTINVSGVTLGGTGYSNYTPPANGNVNGSRTCSCACVHS